MDTATIQSLEQLIKAARVQGALFHPTNPADAYYCECGVFGKGDKVCWSCGSAYVFWQYVPRWGGGCQTMMFEPEEEGGQNER